MIVTSDEGRELVLERYMSPTGTVQETLEIYERINDKNQVMMWSLKSM